MRERKDLYTSREEVELLLKQTRESDEKEDQKRTGKKKKKSVWKIVRRTLYVLAVLVLLLTLGKIWLSRLQGETPSLFGYQVYVVQTGSMDPTLPIGSAILVKQLTDDYQLKVGDVITYNHNDSVITHRIVETVTGEDGILRYQTKGDNPENSPDPWTVAREDVRGVMVWHISI